MNDSVSAEKSVADADKVSDWAVNAMLWATENNILSGYDGMLHPKGNATRAQIAQMLKNYLEGQSTQ